MRVFIVISCTVTGGCHTHQVFMWTIATQTSIATGSTVVYRLLKQHLKNKYIYVYTHTPPLRTPAIPRQEKILFYAGLFVAWFWGLFFFRLFVRRTPQLHEILKTSTGALTQFSKSCLVIMSARNSQDCSQKFQYKRSWTESHTKINSLSLEGHKQGKSTCCTCSKSR